jgi:uncharacterized Fe-S center protein
MTCLMVGSAAMTNVRRIHHYWEEQRKEERRKMAAAGGGKATQKQPGLSFVSFLMALLTGERSFSALPKAYFGC